MSLELRSFGQTGLRIPPVIFGATSLGNLFRAVPEAEKAATIEAWLATDLHPIVIDSAGKYGAGLSLEVIGRELERLGAAEDRVLISNKLAWRRVPLTHSEPTFEPGAWFGLQHDAVQDISYDGILRCWQEGTELLRGRKAQLVSVHDPDEYLAAARDADERISRIQNVVDAYRALRELQAAGQVAAVGVGAKDWKTIQELSRDCDFDWVMFANSFTLMHHPAALAEFMAQLAKRQVAVINSALFHGGFLLGGDFFDYRPVDPAAAGDAERIAWRSRFQSICAEFKVTPFHAGVAFGLAHPAVTAVALSTSRAERVQNQIDCVSTPVPPQMWDAFRQQGLLDNCDFV